MSVKCGNHKEAVVYHEDSAEVRLCYQGQTVQAESTMASYSGIPSLTETYDRQTRRNKEFAKSRRPTSGAGAGTIKTGPNGIMEQLKRAAYPPTPPEAEQMAKFYDDEAEGRAVQAKERAEDEEVYLAKQRAEEAPDSSQIEWERQIRAQARRDAYGRPFKFNCTEVDAQQQPAHVQPHTRAQTTGVRVTEDGMYRIADGTIFKVQWNRASGDGRRLYAKMLLIFIDGEKHTRPTKATAELWDKERDSIQFEYAPGAIFLLSPEDRMTKEEAREFGALYGTCIRCGRTLTLEESIDRMMGKTCAGKI